jgi:hypothetical protein
MSVPDKIMQALSDGLPHKSEDLVRDCLWDGDKAALQTHVCNIRKVLRPRGEDIVCERVNGTTYYRHIRLLASPYDGKR